MQSIDQILLFAEVLIYVILMLQVIFRQHADDVEGYLILYLGLSVTPTLLWLTRLSIGTVPLPSVEIISSWASIVPALAFGALTMAFVRKTRWAIGWLLASAGLFAALVALQLGWLPQPLAMTTVIRVELWALALGGASVTIWVAYRRQTSPMHRNRLRYWLVILALLVVAEGTSLVPGFPAQVAARALNWLAAGLATYVILHVHPPDLKTLTLQIFRFLALTLVLGLVSFGILISVQTFNRQTPMQLEVLLLTGVIAMVMAVLLPGLSSLSEHALNRLFFGTDYDEREVVRLYSQSVSNILDVDRLTARAFDVISDVFNIGWGALLLVQHTGAEYSHILPVRGRGHVPTQPGEVETFGVLMNRFRQSGTPLTQYDIEVLPAYRHIPEAEQQWLSNLKMELFVPIRSQDEVIGLLALGPKRSGEAFRRNELNLLSTLADQTVAALNNAKLVRDLQRLNLDVSQLNAELEAMNQAKADFIGIASHELRTPLSQVNGYAQMLAEELGPNSPFSVFVSGLVRGTTRLTEIVDAMLDVSRLDVEGQALKRTPVALNQVIELAIGEWTSALEERGHTLTTDGLEGLPKLEGDRTRLQQVFSQLINNAIKNTPDGGRIEIIGYAHTENGSGQFVEVIVKDNGIGIDVADQHKIFDKFYRTGDLMKHSTGKTKFKGAGPGLGLSVVKGIVDAHGGRIWVESPGYDEQTCPGSIFHVLLPLRPPEYDPSMAETVVRRAMLSR
jgi:signal transduction histidine kinase